MSINVVLVEPEIPQNTGNIARTCAACGARLHLIGPLGFSIEDKYLKRAGLDYWHLVDVRRYSSIADFVNCVPKAHSVYVSKKAGIVYSDYHYPADSFLWFGKETAGLPETLLKANRHHCVRIPMRDCARSLNLANSAAVIIYEVLRQQGFPDLKKHGILSINTASEEKDL